MCTFKIGLYVYSGSDQRLPWAAITLFLQHRWIYWWKFKLKEVLIPVLQSRSAWTRIQFASRRQLRNANADPAT
jgi:hypothetical protein